MLTVETIGRIRREHFLKGKTIKEIARALRVSRNTVRKILRSGETSFEYERNVQPRPKLGRWTAELENLLTSNAAKPSREQLTLELRGRGYEGGYDAVRRYAKRWSKAHGQSILNILARRRDPVAPITILTPDALKLRHEPVADCARYDTLRRTG